MKDFLKLAEERYSVRKYSERPIEDEKLEKILDAARQAPSGGNNQTNHFLVIQNKAVLQRLIEMTEAAFAKMEADENTYPSLRHAIEASKKGGYVFCYNAPVLIAVANRRDYGNNRKGNSSSVKLGNRDSHIRSRTSVAFLHSFHSVRSHWSPGRQRKICRRPR